VIFMRWVYPLISPMFNPFIESFFLKEKPDGKE